MKVVLLRHSIIPGNEKRQYIGSTDEPLSKSGILLARQFGELSFDGTVFVSPLKRTIQTAEIIFPNTRLEAVADLREMDFGVFEGRSAADMENDPAYQSWIDSECRSVCPDGEGIEGFSRRSSEAFKTIVLSEARRGSEALFFVIHGGSIMAIMDRFTMSEQGYFTWNVKNCCGWCASVSISSGEIVLDDFSAIKSSFEILEALSK